MVGGLVVVDKACFHHDLAAGGVLHGMGAGEPITVCILEPVFYQSVQSLGGAAFAPPCSADAVAHLPHAVAVVKAGPGVPLRLYTGGGKDADAAKHLSGGLFHDGPLVVVLVGIEQRPCAQQLLRLGHILVRRPAQPAGDLRVVGPVRVHHRGIRRHKAAQKQPRRFDFLCAGVAHDTFLPTIVNMHRIAQNRLRRKQNGLLRGKNA